MRPDTLMLWMPSIKPLSRDFAMLHSPVALR